MRSSSSSSSSTSSSMTSSSSFFSSLLSPSLLSLSPLQSIVAFLCDGERIKLCRVNKEHHSILSHIRMNEYHRLTRENWQLIDERHGPIITSIQLNDLNELTSNIPSTQRGQIKRVKFNKITSKILIPRSSLPPLLEELISTTNNEYNEESCRLFEDIFLLGNELPILPSTLKKLILGYRQGELDQRGKNDVTPTEMMKRILSEVTNLTHLGMTVFEVESADEEDIFSVLPDTIETLELHMCTCGMPSETDWPRGLKHLIIEKDYESLQESEIDEIALPPSLVSITFPRENNYEYYEETLQVMSTMDTLRTINFGLGYFRIECNVFALLPRGLTELTFVNGLNWSEDNKTRIDSLPNTIEVLKLEFTNRPITRWPSSLRVLHILGNKFSQDISGLPDSVEDLILPFNYSQIVTKWPKSLKKLNVGAHFFSLVSLEKLPSSIIEWSVSLPIVRRMMSSGTLSIIFPRLIRLILFGRPDPVVSPPFDLRLLPSSLVELRFDREVAQLLGKEDCPNIMISSVDHDVDDDNLTNETDLESIVVDHE